MAAPEVKKSAESTQPIPSLKGPQPSSKVVPVTTQIKAHEHVELSETDLKTQPTPSSDVQPTRPEPVVSDSVPNTAMSTQSVTASQKAITTAQSPAATVIEDDGIPAYMDEGYDYADYGVSDGIDSDQSPAPSRTMSREPSVSSVSASTRNVIPQREPVVESIRPSVQQLQSEDSGVANDADQRMPAEGLPDWMGLIQKMHLKGLVKQLAQQSELLSFDEHLIELRCENRALASNVMAVTGFEKALDAHFGASHRKLKIHVGAAKASPAKVQAQVRAEQQSAAELEINNDATVQALVNTFDGMVLTSSIKAL